MAKEIPMTTTDDTSATRRGSGSNDLLGHASEARWYCLDRDGVAMLCKDEDDARAQVLENDDCWPRRAPHRAALLGDMARLMKLTQRQATEIHRLRERVFELEADPKSGDVIPLAQPREGELRRQAERCIVAWTVVRGGVWDPNGLMDEHMTALRKVLGPNDQFSGGPDGPSRTTGRP
jgi:hypothetical protein